MTDAPERIWIEDEREIGGKLHVFTDPPVKGAEQYVVEYIPRADATRQTQEAVARAERAEAELADLIHDLDRLKESETDALNQVQEAVAAERERCAKVAEGLRASWLSPNTVHQRHTCEAIAAAIREGGK